MMDSEVSQEAYKALAVSVIVQAIKDLKDDNIVRSLDAALFLTGEDVPLWLEAVGMPDVDALAFVTSGKARKLNRRRLEP